MELALTSIVGTSAILESGAGSAASGNGLQWLRSGASFVKKVVHV